MYAEERTSLASINEEELSTILKFDAMTNQSFWKTLNFKTTFLIICIHKEGVNVKRVVRKVVNDWSVCCCLLSALSVCVKTILLTMTSRVINKGSHLIHYLRKIFLVLY